MDGYFVWEGGSEVESGHSVINEGPRGVSASLMSSLLI